MKSTDQANPLIFNCPFIGPPITNFTSTLVVFWGEAHLVDYHLVSWQDARLPIYQQVFMVLLRALGSLWLEDGLPGRWLVQWGKFEHSIYISPRIQDRVVSCGTSCKMAELYGMAYKWGWSPKLLSPVFGWRVKVLPNWRMGSVRTRDSDHGRFMSHICLSRLERIVFQALLFLGDSFQGEYTWAVLSD